MLEGRGPSQRPLLNRLVKTQSGDGENPSEIFVPAPLWAAEIVRANDDRIGEVAVFEKVHEGHHLRASASDAELGRLRVEYGDACELKTRQAVVVTGGQGQTGPLLLNLIV